MRKLLGSKLPTKAVDFMGKKNALEIRKLTGAEMSEFETFVKSFKDKEEVDNSSAKSIQNYLIRLAVTDAADMTDEEIDTFPMEDTQLLAQEILQFSGVKTGAKGND